MRLTMEQLARYCAVNNVEAVIDGDHMMATIYSHGVEINTLPVR